MVEHGELGDGRRALQRRELSDNKKKRADKKRAGRAGEAGPPGRRAQAVQPRLKRRPATGDTLSSSAAATPAAAG